MKRVIVLDELNVATSAGPLGTVAGVQLAAVFQSLLGGLAAHVALPARATCPLKRMSKIAP